VSSCDVFARQQTGKRGGKLQLGVIVHGPTYPIGTIFFNYLLALKAPVGKAELLVYGDVVSVKITLFFCVEQRLNLLVECVAHIAFGAEK
jgi:hypothetical protein